MTLKDEYLKKIDELPTVAYNREQKQLARKIIAGSDEANVAAVYSLLTRRIKTGFVFDEAPEVNHNAVALVKENKKLNINVAGIGELDGVLEHKLIIGENYDALKNLCATYIKPSGEGMIDVIYIDPPYNTEATQKDGNDYKDEVAAKKFIYRDKFTRDGWLNMLNERLKLARKLLSDKGVIFISIDDSEQAYLKVLCDEVFGEENFLTQFTIQVRYADKSINEEKDFKPLVEYVLAYAKNAPQFEPNRIEEEYELDKFIFEIEELSAGEKVSINGYEFVVFKKGEWKITKSKIGNENKLKETWITGSIYSTMSYGKVYKDVVEQRTSIDGLGCLYKVLGRGDDGLGYRYYTGPQKASATKGKMFSGIPLNRLKELKENNAKRYRPIPNLYDFSGEFGNIRLEGGMPFNGGKKPVALIKLLINLCKNKSAIILDFFAGSGTTGQAVMELNEEDGGKRRFILVTNNENGIGEKITRERLHRVITGRGSKGEEIAWKYSDAKPSLTGNGVRVFGIETHALSIEDLKTAEKLKDAAREEFRKLNPGREYSDDFDLYNELAALNPQKKDA